MEGRPVGKCQGGKRERERESSRARADQWKHTAPNLRSAAAAPGEVGEPLRNLTEDEDEEDCLERAPLTAVVVALWRVAGGGSGSQLGSGGLWLALPLPESVPPCQPAKSPQVGDQVRAWLNLISNQREVEARLTLWS